MKKTMIALCAASVLSMTPLAVPSVMAMGSSNNDDPVAGAKMGPDLTEAKDALTTEDYAAAIMKLTAVIEKFPDSADSFNLIGFAYRKMQNYPKSLEYYQEALRLDPDHRGAHEYLGTAYVEMGDLVKAKEHLVKLSEICFFGCDEYSSLKEKVKAAEKS